MSKKILLIEDNPSLAKLTKRGLELELFSVDMAHDGREGLRMASGKKYDLIIVDYMLPGITGLQLCEAVKKKKNKTPIIMLTARDMFRDREAAMKVGIDEYLLKPFSLNELVKKMRILLKKGTSQCEAANQNSEEGRLKGKGFLRTGYCDHICRKENREMIELNKKILENAPISIITINRKGYITSANEYFKTFSKTSDFKSHNIFESGFFKREDLIQDYKELLASGKPVKKENCYERNNKGEDKYLKIVAVPLSDKEGRIEGALSMAIDNTEAVEYRDKLEELNRSLEEKIIHRTSELNAAKRKLEEVITFKTTFMADVSHELRTSLSILQVNLEILKMESKHPFQNYEAFGQISKEVKRMTTMLNDLTLLVNSDSSGEQLELKRLELGRITYSVCKSLEVMGKEKNVSLKYEGSGSRHWLIGDREKLEKLIMNLVKNGLRYNKENGWVKVWIEQDDGSVKLKVEDCGIGIAKKDLPHIFDRFYQANKNRSRSEGGSGLGLAICKWVVDSHHGKIEAKSNLGKGTLFTVELPKEQFAVWTQKKHQENLK